MAKPDGTATAFLLCPVCGDPQPIKLHMTVTGDLLESTGAVRVSASPDSASVDDARRHIEDHRAR